jgi:hypothetical protein
MIRERASHDRSVTIWMNAAGLSIYLVILVAIAFVLALSFVAPARAGLYAVLAMLALVGAGLAVKYRGYAEATGAVTGYWQVGSVGEYLVRREVLLVTGNARVVSEIIVGAATCLYDLLIARRRRAMIMRLGEAEILDLLRPFLASARQGTRYLPANGLTLDPTAVSILIANEVLWCSVEGGILRLGVNRLYDDAG